MKQSPQISILMPAYNAGKYLQEAIDSMLNQTFTNFELLILDDCSTDNTNDIVQSYNDSRIQYIRQEKNIGLANNLNVGLKLAQGKYIARMDGDDISLPERLQVQYEFLESHPDIDLCSCGLEMFGKDNQVWIRERDPEQVKITMMFYSPVLHATSVWRRESFEKHNLYYNQDTFPAEDYDLWSRAIFHCTLVNIPQVLYKYRIHGVQITYMDDRAIEKSKEIQFDYIKKAGDNLSDIFVQRMISEFIYKIPATKDDFKKMKNIYREFLKLNTQNNFFDYKKLTLSLNKRYQSSIIKFLKTDKVVFSSLLFDLSFKNFIKLLLK